MTARTRWCVRLCVMVMMLAGAVALNAAPANACSCGRLPLERDARAADAVFVGTIMTAVAGDSYSMQVSEIYKGIVQPEVTVVGGDSAMCGFDFDVASDYVVFAHRSEDRWLVSGCSRSGAPTEERLDVVAQVLGAPRQPEVAPSGDVPTSHAQVAATDSSPSRLLLGAVAGASLIGGMVLLYRRRRRQS